MALDSLNFVSEKETDIRAGHKLPNIGKKGESVSLES